MDFLTWHYSQGVKYYAKRYLNSIASVVHTFSLPVLVNSLFAPWKKILENEKTPGFDPAQYFQKISFNFVSRVVGFMTRITLLMVAAIALVTIVFFGSIGFLVWLLLPFLSFPIFEKYKKLPSVQMDVLNKKISKNYNNAINEILDSNFGAFLLEYTNIDKEELLSKKDSQSIQTTQIKTPNDAVQILFTYMSDNFLNKNELKKEDITTLTNLWEKSEESEYSLEAKKGPGAGIGRELLTGYTPKLNEYSQTMGQTNYDHHLVGRKNVVSQMRTSFETGRSVVLTGAPGVGKKTVIEEFAKKALYGELGANLSYKRVVELDYNSLLSNTTDANQKKNTLTQILKEAENAGNIILVVNDIQRITTEELDGIDTTDVFNQILQKRKLSIVAVSSEADFERYVAKNEKLMKYFNRIVVNQTTKEESLEILLEAAIKLHKQKGIVLTIQAARKLIDESDRYITQTPFPEKVIELLDTLIIIKQGGSSKIITTDDVNKVMGEKTGISFQKLTDEDKLSLVNLEETIHKTLVNQNNAVNLIAQTLRARTTNVIKNERPIGSFLFLGPTGVGKTETARVLSQVYFQDESRIIRLNMSEYQGQEGIERLIGSIQKNTPGSLATSIKNHPSSLLLLDELEKAPKEVLNIFLALLDEGKFSDAFNQVINCQNLFVIATSNAAASYIHELVKNNTNSEDLQKNVVEYVLENKLFPPEFINRFDAVVVYEPLSKENLKKVVEKELGFLINNMKEKGIMVKVEDSAIEKITNDGYSPEFGARPIRRIIETQFADKISQKILTSEVGQGDSIAIKIVPENNSYIVEKL